MNKNKPTYEMLEAKIKILENSVDVINTLKTEIKLNHSFLEMLFDAIPSPIFYKDKDGIYINCNDAFSNNILGISKKDIIGKSLYDFPQKIPKENADIYYKKDKELLETTTTQYYEAEVKCADDITRYYNFYKATFMSEDGEALGIIGIMMDITELQKQDKKLRVLASIDHLTNLYNRRHLTEIAEPLLSLSKRNNKSLCILMIDIDNFKNINDTYGHKTGDDVIVALSNELLSMSRESDVISRWGGEEFLMLLPETDIKGALSISQKIRREIEKLVVNEYKIKFTISIGASEFNSKSDDLEKLINRADTALYKSKKSGRNKVSST